MYENLPRLSEATRELVCKEVDKFSKLTDLEMQGQLDEELAQLEQINQWVAGGVRATAYCIQQVDAVVQHDSDIPEEVKSFWQTFGPYIKVRVLKAALILLTGIDRELWVREMEAKVNVKETIM